MARVASRIAALMVTALAGGTAQAHADWLITPFLGATFAAQTTFLDFEQGTDSTQFVFGGSGAWLTDGIIGFEGEFMYAPRFFESDNRAGLVTNSYLYTLSGNVIVTLPLSVTRESLRPYVTGGLGMMDGHLEDLANPFPEFTESQERASAAFNVGGGVIGFVTTRIAARFDLRHVRSLARDEDLLTGDRRAKLSFWRFVAGITFRY